jgi:hypothetical protein
MRRSRAARAVVESIDALSHEKALRVNFPRPGANGKPSADFTWLF